MKRILFSALIALVLLFAVSSTVLGADPIVSVNVNTPSGDVTITTNGIDTSTWHPGSIGQTDTFHAVGGFTASYDAYGGNYGRLGTYINASGAYGTGAAFQLNSFQDFNVLSANVIHNVTSTFTAIASNSNDQVALNLKIAGSMYVWSEATNPYSQPGLRGNYIYKGSQAYVSGVPTAFLQEWISTDGVANMNNTNIWGWGNDDDGNIFTNYGGGVRNVLATGNGAYGLDGAGGSLLTINGNVNAGNGSGSVVGNFPVGGALTYIFNFLNGMTGTYSMAAK